ncbi:hypothetical protein A2U01_0115558, partial [Trifolium medium]|nr:hypothetical protein [Trifolium medium]
PRDEEEEVHLVEQRRVVGCKREGQDSGGTWICSGVLNGGVQGWREHHSG